MTSFLHITDSFKRTFEHRFEPEYRDQFAMIYWYSLLLIVGLGVLWFAWTGFVLFTGILKDFDTAPRVSKEVPVQPLNKADLDHFVASYNEKKAQFETFQTVSITIPSDPSN